MITEIKIRIMYFMIFAVFAMMALVSPYRALMQCLSFSKLACDRLKGD